MANDKLDVARALASECTAIAKADRLAQEHQIAAVSSMIAFLNKPERNYFEHYAAEKAKLT